MYGSRGASDSSSGIPVSGSARAFLGHVLAQLLERGPLQPRDVHLAYAQPAGDLGLRHLLVEPHGHDCPLARSRTSRISARSSSGSEPPICSATERLSCPSPAAMG